VAAVDPELGHLVVVERVRAGLDVALLAVLTEPTLVGVVLGVAALGRARGLGGGKIALGMAGLALVVLVLALELEAIDLALMALGERLVVIEPQRVPGPGCMAGQALRA
jgi:hypothetical protein